MNIKITADSTCDISVADLKRHNIDLFPLDVIVDGQAYKDGVDIFPADLINAVEKEKKTCSTAAISIGDYKPGVFGLSSCHGKKDFVC